MRRLTIRIKLHVLWNEVMKTQPPANFIKTAKLLLAALLFVNAFTGCSTPRKTASGMASPQVYLAGVTRELEKSWPTNRTVNIVCHGHSVPSGYSRTPLVETFNAYPHLLHVGLCSRFPHAVINVIVTGIGGENSEQGAKRFMRDVLSLRPDVVTIDYALNDRNIGLARAEAAWRKMIEACLARKIPVLLLTPTADLKANLDDANDPLNQQAEQIRRLAAEYHVGLVDSLAQFRNFARAGGNLPALMAQPNHPNRKGHELVAAELLKWFPKTTP
jgi:acyl-CoA thioesterase I